MLTSSCKQKGRLLQQYVVKKILTYFSMLSSDDVTSRSMGCGGEDILLSPKARDIMPVSWECKSKKAIAIYKDYEQCRINAKDYTPILVIKQNNSKPLAVIDLDILLAWMV